MCEFGQRVAYITFLGTVMFGILLLKLRIFKELVSADDITRCPNFWTS